MSFVVICGELFPHNTTVVPIDGTRAITSIGPLMTCHDTKCRDMREIEVISLKCSVSDNTTFSGTGFTGHRFKISKSSDFFHPTYRATPLGTTGTLLSTSLVS